MSVTHATLPYQVRWAFTAIFLKPVPRVLMPTRPLGASALFTRELAPEAYDSGLVTGLGAWGEWYLNFSWLGLILGMALTGALCSAVYKTTRETTGFGRVLFYSSLLVVLISWLRNDFNSATTYG